MLVSRTPTPVEESELFAILAGALRAQGVADTRRTVRGLGAIIALENARGASIIQHNWGNLMAAPTWRAQGRDWWEVDDPQPNQPCCFRAYADHTEGAAAFVRTVRDQHPAALDWAALGAYRELGLSLFRSGYVSPSYPGHDRDYSRSLETIARDYEARGVPPPSGRERREQWLAAGVSVAGITALGISAWRAGA